VRRLHQSVVLACLIREAGGKLRKEIRRYGTTTRELKPLREWLLSMGCTHVAMESTGVYWTPACAVLEGSLAIMVGNARPIKNLPGRTTDAKDCEWVGDLLRHRLIAKSFVPPEPVRELHDLTRYRRKLKLVEAGDGAQTAVEAVGDGEHQAGRGGERCVRPDG
jgi:transposase